MLSLVGLVGLVDITCLLISIRSIMEFVVRLDIDNVSLIYNLSINSDNEYEFHFADLYQSIFASILISDQRISPITIIGNLFTFSLIVLVHTYFSDVILGLFILISATDSWKSLKKSLVRMTLRIKDLIHMLNFDIFVRLSLIV